MIKLIHDANVQDKLQNEESLQVSYQGSQDNLESMQTNDHLLLLQLFFDLLKLPLRNKVIV